MSGKIDKTKIDKIIIDKTMARNRRNKMDANKSKILVILAVTILIMLLTACGEAEKCAYDDKPVADLSRYPGMESYYTDSQDGSDKGSDTSSDSEEKNGSKDNSGSEEQKGEDIRLVDTTVKEIEKMMKDGETFAFIASFADCPYCNQLMPYFNEAAKRADRKAGHLDTRKDPKWNNNMDIDNYDIFVKLFGKYLDEEDDGKAHLYTPMIFFIKDGEIVAYHKNVIEGVDDPNEPLTKRQENKLNKMLDEKFEQMN